MFTYDPGSGEVRRLPHQGTGGSTGAPRDSRTKYLRFQVRGRYVYAHRIAWCLMTGDWPHGDIDHVNGDGGDNRWLNLRVATRAENSQNVGGPRADNTSGYLGVTWHKRAGKWAATIRANGIRHHLGLFVTREDAAAAYREAKARLHSFAARM